VVGGSFFCIFLALCFCPPSCSFSFSLFCFGFSSLSAGGGACNNPTFQAQNNSKFLFFLYLTHIVLVIDEHVPFTSSIYNPYINNNQHFQLKVNLT